VLGALVQGAIGVQLGFDLVVRRQRLGVGRAQRARRLALGERVVLDAVLGHDAGRRRRNPCPHALLTRAPAAHPELPRGAARAS